MASERNAVPGVVGDFVLAVGAKASARAGSPEGFVGLEGRGDSYAGVRGAVSHGARRSEARWMAISDLIRGEIGEAVAVLEGERPQRSWRGRFAAVAWTIDGRSVSAFTDHFSTLSLYVLETDGGVIITTDLRLMAKLKGFERKLDLEAIYHYFNFAHVPAPRTIFAEVKRLEPGTCYSWRDGASSMQRYYMPEYPEDLDGTDEVLASQLRERMIETVRAYRPDHGARWGCFLSGGTDSTSIVSILSRQSGRGTVASYSIGFQEPEFDELPYARLAASECGANARTGVVSSSQSLELVQRVIGAYDQPFGGASAVPTIACVDLACEDGVSQLVGGDGGDEIFGGNARYAKDQVMEAWYSMPRPIKAAGRALGDAVGDSRFHLLNRVENFFERASLPNPDRFYSDDSFASDHYEAMLTPEFREAVAREASLDFLRSIYWSGETGGRMHRLMRLDLLMAVAQHDLRKVHCAARIVGVTVRFPYLDPDLVDYVNRLSERQKVRGITKRYLFRKAMDGIVPTQVLHKKKQGFGLPIPVWMREEAAFRDIVRDTLTSRRANERGWWNAAFLERLLAEHLRGSWDHSDYLWRVFILELWLRRYVDAS